jgi:hypothetical protein
MECICKIPEPRMKVSENSTSSYCGKCAKKYDNKTTSLIYSFANEIREEYTTTITPFQRFLETNNLMQKGKPKTDPIVTKVLDSFKQRSKIGIDKYGTTLEDNNSDDYLQHLQEELMDAILYIEKLKSLRL